ncbi:MAG: DNA replication/repair protein RecF [Bacillota bacterium]|nr:DNA replication/repair protein RecF [Bacillota bacterium]
MIATGLRLENFRSYRTLELKFGPGVNVFSGHNAQGKTNILEAIYICSCARSHRTARDQELIFRGASAYSIELDYTLANGTEESIKLQYGTQSPDGRPSNERRFWHNRIRQERIADLYGLFNAVIFAPEDLMLVKEGPIARRRFLDLLLAQIRPRYFAALQRFNRILKQRNQLLKRLRDQQPMTGSGAFIARPDLALDYALLDAWDEQYADLMAELIGDRFELTGRIRERAAVYHSLISGDRETLDIRYRTMSGLKPEQSSEERCSLIRRRLEQLRRDDIVRGTTSIGAHRDDLDLRLDEQPLKLFGSQGQQRTAVLAMKLAELAVFRDLTGQTPVLLLDDVMSELDRRRRQALIAAMRDCQVMLTCTDTEQVQEELRELAGGQPLSFFHVDCSQVTALDTPGGVPGDTD